MSNIESTKAVRVHEVKGLIPHRRVSFPKTDYSKYNRVEYEDGRVEFIPIKE